MSTFNTLHPRGHVTNAGRFSERTYSVDEITLTGVDHDYDEVTRFLIDGEEVIVTGLGIEGSKNDPSVTDANWQVIGDPHVVTFFADPNSSTGYIRQLAEIAYNTARVNDMKSKLGEIRELDKALTAEIDRLSAGLTHLRAPDDWAGEYELTAVTAYMYNRVEGDDCYARADYAEVNEHGIAYAYRMNASLIGDILVGQQKAGESETDYAERIDAASDQTTWGKVEEFFSKEFSADVNPDGDYGDMTAEFMVEYGSEGVDRASIQQMGDRAESETKLLDLRNSWEYGGHVQDDLARHLGYRYERVENTSEFQGHYVKEDA
jgi:hypothetical protein